MKDTLKIVVGTIVIFASGLLMGLCVRPLKPLTHVPPMPLPPLSEFDDEERGRPFDFDRLPPEKAKEMREQMEKMKPKIEEFKSKIESIKETSRAKLKAVLREDQKAKFDEIYAKQQQGPPPPRGEKMKEKNNQHSPMVRHFEFLGMVIYKPMLEKISQELKLDDNQKKSFEEILVQRRKDILDLIDATPPPSLEFDRPPHPPMEMGREGCPPPMMGREKGGHPPMGHQGMGKGNGPPPPWDDEEEGRPSKHFQEKPDVRKK